MNNSEILGIYQSIKKLYDNQSGIISSVLSLFKKNKMFNSDVEIIDECLKLLEKICDKKSKTTSLNKCNVRKENTI